MRTWWRREPSRHWHRCQRECLTGNSTLYQLAASRVGRGKGARFERRKAALSGAGRIKRKSGGHRATQAHT